MNRRRLSGFLWALKWFGIVALVTFATDMLYVFWPYPDGPRGVEPLRHTVANEARLIQQLADERSMKVIRVVEAAFYRVCFVWTGLDAMMRRFADPRPLSRTDEAMRRFFLANWEFLETAVDGLRLFSMRVGVLLLAGPIFLIMSAGAIVDGLVTWFRRRTGGNYESGFLYHRTKRGLQLGMVVCWLVYLVPPVVVEPRYVLPPVLVTLGIAIRVAVGYFKKYV